jgi:hypothetical protein
MQLSIPTYKLLKLLPTIPPTSSAPQINPALTQLVIVEPSIEIPTIPPILL